MNKSTNYLYYSGPSLKLLILFLNFHEALSHKNKGTKAYIQKKKNLPQIKSYLVGPPTNR